MGLGAKGSQNPEGRKKRKADGGAQGKWQLWREGREKGRKRRREGGTGWSHSLKNMHVNIHDVPGTYWAFLQMLRFT